MIDSLGPAERAALARQGTVCIERRGDRLYYKLRFRVDGRQRVRYIGRCPERAEQVRQQLRALQQPLRDARRIRKLIKTNRCAFAAARRQLAPLLRQAGYAFHGRSVRRPRQAQAPILPPAGPSLFEIANDDATA